MEESMETGQIDTKELAESIRGHCAKKAERKKKL